jgi:hypothetical protein
MFFTRCMFFPQESISTCRFAQRVACVKNSAIVNEETDPMLIIRKYASVCSDAFALNFPSVLFSVSEHVPQHPGSQVIPLIAVVCCRLKTEIAALKAEIAFLKGEQGEDTAMTSADIAAMYSSAQTWVRSPDDAPFDVGALTVCTYLVALAHTRPLL